MFYGRVSGLAFAIAALACAGAASNPVFAQSAEPLSPEDIFLLEAAAEPRIAPDGSTIAYIRRSNDIMTDQTRSSIWLVDTDGSNHRPLVAGDAQVLHLGAVLKLRRDPHQVRQLDVAARDVEVRDVRILAQDVNHVLQR